MTPYYENITPKDFGMRYILTYKYRKNRRKKK